METIKTIIKCIAICVISFRMGVNWQKDKSINKPKECEHEWGNWFDWAITYEKRKCNKCGKSQTRCF